MIKTIILTITFTLTVGLLSFGLKKLMVRFGNFLSRKLFCFDGGGAIVSFGFFFLLACLVTSIGGIIALISGNTDMAAMAIVFTILSLAIITVTVFFSKRAHRKRREENDEKEGESAE